MIKEEGWGVWDFVTVTLTSLTSILNPIKSKQLWITFNSEISNKNTGMDQKPTNKCMIQFW